MRRWLAITILLLGGCTTVPDNGGRFEVPGGRYAAAFDAARAALVDMRFELDRVDARVGVVQTLPKGTAGWATPWDQEQSSIEQEVEDVNNQQYRRVRVVFEPQEAAGGAPEEVDLRVLGAPLSGRVEVYVDRVRRPGWRPATSAIRSSSYAEDPLLTGRSMWPRYTVPIRRDTALEARLAVEIARRMGPAPGP